MGELAVSRAFGDSEFKGNLGRRGRGTSGASRWVPLSESPFSRAWRAYMDAMRWHVVLWSSYDYKSGAQSFVQNRGTAKGLRKAGLCNS